jgi:sugar transferase EpsL
MMTDRALAAAPASLYVTGIKPACDFISALALILILLPLVAIVAVAVRCILGRPVLFRDERAGLAGRPIRVAKFRSMTTQTDRAGRLLPDAERLGGFGRLLRRTSLDELPQLFSVLSGDMSLVGPRPLPLRYVHRYDARQATRLSVRPGLTGWAQIHGRNAVDWPRRLEYDAEYVEILGHWYAPLADLWIVLATVFQILWQAVTGRGISAPGAATMQEFAP